MSLFARIIIAVVCFVLAMALLLPLARIFGVALDPDIITVVRVCLAGIALFYVLRGDRWFPRGT